MRTRGMSCTGRHSCRIMHFLECVFTLEHCICTLVESSPFRVIPLLSISSSCRENIFSGTGSARGDGSS